MDDRLDLNLFDDETLAGLHDVRAADGEITIDEIAEDFEEDAGEAMLGFGPGDLSTAFKTELRLLVCGGEGSDHYKEFHQTAESVAKKSQGALIGAMAGVMALQLGVEAAVIAPYLTRAIMLALKVGYRTFCRALTPQCS